MHTIQIGTGGEPEMSRGGAMKALGASAVSAAILLVGAGLGSGIAQAGGGDWNVDALEAFFVYQLESRPVLSFEEEVPHYSVANSVTDDMRLAGPVETGGMSGEKGGQAAIPGPSEVSLAKYPLTVGSGEFDLVNQILEFPAGTGVGKHRHGGYVVVTVLSGEMTLREKGTEQIIRAGGSWTESPGNLHSVMNAGTTTARVAVSYLIPKGAEIISMEK